MTTRSIETSTHCAYCGHRTAGEADAPERFGERFCSDEHAEEFVAGVRAVRMEAAARAEVGASREADEGGACALPPPGQRGWRDYVKRGACWGAPLLVLAAIPLFWSGGWGAAGGPVLTGLALVACPLGMYFMMRGMMTMHQDGGSAHRRKEDHHA